MRIAALDLGTNSFHLLDAEVSPDGSIVPVAREKEMLRLGDVVAREGRLLDADVDRAVASVRRMRLVCELATLLRLADGLDRGRAQTVEGVDVRITPDLVLLRIRTSTDVELELWGERRKRELFERVFDRELELTTHPAGLRGRW